MLTHFFKSMKDAQSDAFIFYPQRQKKSKGFTLVELIVVVVILGVLSATSMPKFINMRREARIAALSGMAGALRSALTEAQAAYHMSSVEKDRHHVVLPVTLNGEVKNVHFYGRKARKNGASAEGLPVGAWTYNAADSDIAGACTGGANYIDNSIVAFLQAGESARHIGTPHNLSGSVDLLRNGFATICSVSGMDPDRAGLFFYPSGITPETSKTIGDLPQCYTQYNVNWSSSTGLFILPEINVVTDGC